MFSIDKTIIFPLNHNPRFRPALKHSCVLAVIHFFSRDRIGSMPLPFVLLALSGCGGGSSGGSATFGSSAGGSSSTTTTTPTGTASSYTLSVDTDIKTGDVNIGTVLATATLKTKDGTLVPDQTITFTVLAGPATIGTPTQVTDTNGTANAIVTTQDTPYTTNVLLEAKTVVLGVTYRAYTSIQIVRGTGIISIPFGSGPTTGPGSLGTASKSYPTTVADGTIVGFVQQIPFKLTDSNGNPRVGVPVTLSVYSQTDPSVVVTIDYHAPTVTEPSASRVTTDSAGEGIFNVTIDNMVVPPAGTTNTVSVVYKAVTNDASPVTAYVGGMYSVSHAESIAVQ